MEQTFSINLRTCGISIGGALAGLGLVQFLRLFFIKMRHGPSPQFPIYRHYRGQLHFLHC